MTLLLFLIGTAFGVLGIACLLRFLFQATAVNPANPVADSTRRLTDKLLSPLRKSLPKSNRFDVASFLVCWLAFTGRVAVHDLQGPSSSIDVSVAEGPLQLAIYSLGESLVRIVQYSVWIFIAAIVVLVALSWFAPQSTSPYAQLARELPAFMLNPVRRFLPSLGIFDLSPAIVLIALVTINSRIVPWLGSMVPYAS